MLMKNKVTENRESTINFWDQDPRELLIAQNELHLILNGDIAKKQKNKKIKTKKKKVEKHVPKHFKKKEKFNLIKFLTGRGVS